MSDLRFPNWEAGGRRLVARLLNALGQLQFLLLLVFPYFVLLAVSVLHQFTFGAPENIQRLYDSFPRHYEIALPSNNSGTAKREMIAISGKRESVVVRVSVSPATEYRARIIWLIASFTFLMVALGAATINGWIIWHSLRDWRIWVVVSLFGLYFLGRLNEVHNIYDAVGENLENIGKNPNLELLSYLAVFAPLKGLDESFYSFAWVIHLSCVLLLAVVMATSGLAAATTVAAPPAGEKSTENFLAEQIQCGQIFLYTACICLTVGVIDSAVWLRWPIELMPPGNLRDELAAYVTFVAALIGVAASFLILSAYLPMALIHRARARKLARKTLLEKKQPTKEGAPVGIRDNEIRTFLQDNRLQIPLISQFQGIGAMLLPALVSPLISAIGTLTTVPN